MRYIISLFLIFCFTMPVYSAFPTTQNSNLNKIKMTFPTTQISDHPNKVTGTEINFEQKTSVEKGLKWLASEQGEKGEYCIGSDGNVGVTALAGLAFMQAGNLPDRGKYGKNVKLCLENILSNCQEAGFICSSRENMYSHCFSTLFLAEIYEMTGNETIKEKLEKAIHLIERCQNDDGGWRYLPIKTDDSDISVTISAISALRSARDAGIKVRIETINKAISYIKKSQSKNGGFVYQIGDSGENIARTAGAIVCLYHLGEFDGKEIDEGLKYLDENMNDANINFYFYTHYYLSQALFLSGGKRWEEYYPKTRDDLIKRQKENGNWDGDSGEHFATAMALLILEIPNKYLPINNGKGPGD